MSWPELAGIGPILTRFGRKHGRLVEAVHNVAVVDENEAAKFESMSRRSCDTGGLAKAGYGKTI